MKMLNFKAVVWFVKCSTSMLLFYSTCKADNSNASTGWECSQADKSTSEYAFQTNLNNLLNSLAAEAPLRNGFYKSTEGKGSNKVYGLVQCRGDVSAPDCANCTKESISVALQDCSKSKQVKVWFKWCLLHYSDEDFFGVLDPTSVAKTNDTNFDDPSVVPRGFNLMTELAVTAPKHPLMFQTAELDAGASGKRYGMAQCNRDISRSDCSNCLSGQLVTFRTTVGNKRDWEIYGSSCSMWYHDFQFYFNISTLASEGGRELSPSPAIAIGMILAVVKLLLLF
ncbi:hypothetical protein JRO89_XS06G0097400 [Xanthoceras sorbifolium]|uniref:Gnk2-homologous domain-containing protein n=1 Tax=Xanthoceras sorbifolium TaxID=99658 RepID=A0ABQ8HXW0_9ROSI|nr:hypothetical protein JRO89_XS06G0097400 [Xanthoceras sorbifolium]